MKRTTKRKKEVLNKIEIPAKALQLIEKKKKELDLQIKEILIQEAKAQCPYAVGDILEDHYQIGKVLRITYQYSLHSLKVECAFTCTRLKKDLTPYKNDEGINIYLQNIEKVH